MKGAVGFRSKGTGQTIEVAPGETYSALVSSTLKGWKIAKPKMSDECELVNTYNDKTVQGNGQPVHFTLMSPVIVSEIMRYHYNGGRGARPGAIAVRETNGKTYGPSKARLSKGVNWYVFPNVIAPRQRRGHRF